MEITARYRCGCVETTSSILHCETKKCLFDSYKPEELKEELPLGKVNATDIYFYSHIAAYQEFSNFWRAALLINGKTWPTVEHYYQEQKSVDPVEKEYIRRASHPAEAKKLGRRVIMRQDWELVKEGVMFKALWAKFTQHDKLKKILIGTGKVALHEDSPYDKYWGCRDRDRLGIVLGQVRNALNKV